MLSESTQIMIQIQKDKLWNQTACAQISVLPITQSANSGMSPNLTVSPFLICKVRITVPNEATMTNKWIRGLSKPRKMPAHGKLFVPELIINDDDSRPPRSGFGTIPFSPSRFLLGGGQVLPIYSLSLDVGGSLWKNEQAGLNNLQFPFQVAYYMLSFGSKELVFKNSPQIWGIHRSLIL